MLTEHYLVLFDGVCNLCTASVQFIIERDPQGKFTFASLQSEYGRKVLSSFGADPTSLHSLVLVANHRLYERSDAALEIARHLRGGWRYLYILRFVPRVIRDACYKLVAANRYHWFGKKNECWLPSGSLQARFLS